MNLWSWAGRLPSPVRRVAKAIPGAVRLRDSSVGCPQGAVAPGLRPIVYLPTWLEWDVMQQRPQYLLAALARRGHPVFFVDPRLRREERRDEVRLVPSLRQVPRQGVILYLHFAPSWSLIDRFDRPVIWYDVLDDLAIYDRGERLLPERRRVRHLHPQVVEKADVVTCSNPILLGRVGRSDAILVENGVDLDRFRIDGPRATDLPSGAVVGFHGAVAPWLDFGLIAEVAGDRPHLQFVFVGPIDPTCVDRLPHGPNLHWLGARPSALIADYVRAFDVAWIPFLVDDMTRGVSPLKLYEALACGKPVVSTPLPAALDLPGVRVGSTVEEIAGLVDSALESDGDTESLREVATAAGWDRRLQPLIEHLRRSGWEQTS